MEKFLFEDLLDANEQDEHDEGSWEQAHISNVVDAFTKAAREINTDFMTDAWDMDPAGATINKQAYDNANTAFGDLLYEVDCAYGPQLMEDYLTKRGYILDRFDLNQTRAERDERLAKS